MRHFPIFLDLRGKQVAVAGGNDCAIAKLRLLLKTEARITVFAERPAPEITVWEAEGRLRVVRRPVQPGDAVGVALFYAATDIEEDDARAAELARADGALVNMVDDLEGSEFITPAIVDRDPVTVAIGTEGTAPVLGRGIKAHLEQTLSPALGRLARIAGPLRHLANAVPPGRARRSFWSEYFDSKGPDALATGGDAAVPGALKALAAAHGSGSPQRGRIDFVGAGPGDPELLTLRARKALDRADVVIHDRLVAPEILELARREARIIDAGKTGFGASMPQQDINELVTAHAIGGAHVVRLKSGDPTVYGRLDEEIDAATAAGVDYAIVPGITSASASVAALGQSLTKRDRNSAIRFLTGHDMKGFAEHDWTGLARSGEVAAIYMGKRTARFIQGRLLMHGADPDTPVTIVENASRPDQVVLASTLGRLEPDLSAAQMSGPALVLYGLAPRNAEPGLAALPPKVALEQTK